MWGGHYGPDNHKQLHCLYIISARPTKISDFVPFYDWMVLGKSFFNFFFEIFEKSKKMFLTVLTSKGPPFEKKFKNFEKISFFANNHTFSFWICILHVFSFLLRYVTVIYLKISNFDLFMLEIFHFLPQSFGSQYCQNYSSKTVVYGVYGQLKIKKIKYKSFLGFRLSLYSFRMP